MKNNHKLYSDLHVTRSNRLHVFGLLALLVAVVELVLCFAGPLSFIQKPSLMLFPPFSVGLTGEETSRAGAYIERQIALTNSYSVTSSSFMEEYFVRTDPEYEESRLKPVDAVKAQEIALELELERFAVAWIYSSSYQCELSVSIRDTTDGTVLRSGRYVSDSLENLLAGVGRDGEAFTIRDDLSFKTRGITFTDFLVLALIGLQLSVGLAALMGREPGILVELAWAQALLLFLFAYIYALSANMDYVQRYIASSGQLKLAESTTVEQLYALLRFGPILIIDGVYHVLRTLEKRRQMRLEPKERWVHRYVAAWALPWVVLSAVLFGFAFPSSLRLDGMSWLAWFCLVPLFLVLLSVKPAKGVFYGVVFGTLQSLIVNYWHGTYDYVTLHLITSAFFLEYVLFMLVLVWLIRGSGKWGFLTVPCAWVLFDYIRSIGVLGYPWSIIGTTQYRFLSLIQIASVTGVWGIDFVVLLCNASLAWALARGAFGWRWVGRTRIAPSHRSFRSNMPRQRAGIRPLQTLIEYQTLFPPGVCALIFGVCVMSGAVILHRVQNRLYDCPEVPKATVVLLQQNTDPRKHEYRKNLEKLMELTDGALDRLHGKPDLIVWPEGGFKLDIRYWTHPDKRKSYWGRVVREFLDYQRSLETWLLTGTQDHEMISDGEGGQKKVNYNSSVLLDSRGMINAFYHKMHLVPFSEYFPLDKKRFAGLYELFQKYEISNWELGDERLVYQHDRMRVATPICFEDVFSDHVRRFVLQDVDIILNISNDYWSLSPVEGRQHGLIALFRAVENHRPVLRSTSSGYTVYIDAVGRIHPGSPEPYTEGYALARIPLPEKRLTIYTRWGDWFPRGCGIALLLCTVFWSLRWITGSCRAVPDLAGSKEEP
jgi:apolipoprotein N-acyltransferase